MIRLFCFLAMLGLMLPASAQSPARPNILWITAEDMGPHLKCYGFDYAETPHLDALAARGVRYRKCWSNAPVCAPSRTTLITGMYPTSLGAEHMRSEVRLPDGIKLYPSLMREAGYYCTNNNKEDYNLPPDKKLWNESSKKAHYRNRAPGQPFLSVINFTGTHESQIRTRPHKAQHDPAKVPLPAYHPDTPEIRQDWAQYHDNITAMDRQAGRVLEELKADGLADDTIVFFYGDHGSGMPRSKRWPFNSGLHVPLIVHIPDKWKALAPSDYVAGRWSERLVSFVDFAPTLLSLAGLPAASWHQGKAFLGQYQAAPQKLLFGFRGRMDERMDLVRSVTDGRFVYVRNFMPHRIYGAHIDYMFQTPTTRIWKELYDAGKLTPPRTFFWERKPAEELYDLKTDPDEVQNLVAQADQADRLAAFRKELSQHLITTRDTAFLTESGMIRRAGKSAIHTMAQDESQYPLPEILTAADAASRPLEGLDRKAGLAGKDPAVRFWALTGLLIAGREVALPWLENVRPLLRDPAPEVQIAAAEVLGLFGSDADAAAAVTVLKTRCDVPGNGPALAISALTVLDGMGSRAGDLQAFLKALETRDDQTPGRYKEYVPRLVQDLQK